MEEQVKKDEELARKLQQEECEAAGDLGKAMAASLAEVNKPSFIDAEKAIQSGLLPDPKAKPASGTSTPKSTTSPIHGGIDPNKSPILKNSNRKANIYYIYK